MSPDNLKEFNSSRNVGITDDGEAPVKIEAMTRLKSDLTAFSVLLAKGEPYRVPTRVKKNGWVGYGMSDASRDGFGAAFYIDGAFFFRYEQWASSISEESSNYRELRDLVEALEKDAREVKLTDCEVFLLTDNLVAEHFFFKGSPSSETLLKLVLRLRKLELEGEIILHIIHYRVKG